jgi:hypothetical protein
LIFRIILSVDLEQIERDRFVNGIADAGDDAFQLLDIDYWSFASALAFLVIGVHSRRAEPDCGLRRERHRRRV